MKKNPMHLLALIVLIGTIIGCSKDSGINSPAPSPSLSISNEPLHFSISLPTTGTGGYSVRVDLKTEKWINKLAELYDVHMNVRVTEDDKLGFLLAGREIPDVVGTYGTPTSLSMSGSVESGLFHPLTELIKEHTPELYDYVPKAAWDAVSFDGEIYGIPSFLRISPRRATYIRMDLLEKTGKDVPRTIDEFIDVLRAFKEIGVQHPYAMRENFKYSDIIFGAYDVLPYKDQFTIIDDEVVPKFFKAEEMQQALGVMKDMYDEGLIPRNFATITVSDFFKNIESGNAAMWSQNAIGLTSLTNVIHETVPEADVQIIPSPIGPEGKGGYLFYPPVVTSYYINKNVELERVIQILKHLEWQAMSEEAAMFYTFGVEGDTYSIDENGNVDYFGAPTTREEQEEEDWRGGTLWLASDTTVNRLRNEIHADGWKIVDALDSILVNEGLGGIGFYPELESFAKYPALAPLMDIGPQFIVDNIVQMIYSVKPISEWPIVLEEYRALGGDEIIREATERYNNGEGFVDLLP